MDTPFEYVRYDEKRQVQQRKQFHQGKHQPSDAPAPAYHHQKTEKHRLGHQGRKATPGTKTKRINKTIKPKETPKKTKVSSRKLSKEEQRIYGNISSINLNDDQPSKTKSNYRC